MSVDSLESVSITPNIIKQKNTEYHKKRILMSYARFESTDLSGADFEEVRGGIGGGFQSNPTLTQNFIFMGNVGKK